MLLSGSDREGIVLAWLYVGDRLFESRISQSAIPVGHHRVNRSKSVKPIIQSGIALDNRPLSDIPIFVSYSKNVEGL